MTREEAILCIKGIKNLGHDMFTEQKDFQECLDMAIKALEQESILDKIRAEIIKYEGDCRLSVDEYPSCKQCNYNMFGSIYAILYKYKTESDDKE
jgi:hypothetical protein